MPTMRIFLSAGEPSGDLHGANLVCHLRALAPGATCAGFGGRHMRAAGCDIFFPLAEHAIMGLTGIARALPTMFRLRRQMTAWVAAHRPDAVVLIDYPGFHWWLASRAKDLGVPVVSFVPPQVWAWASHRVSKVRAYFDEVLCSLPFEEPWYRERGVAARYVGHPYFDELAGQRLDAAFVAAHRGRPGPVVAMLPGSRTGEIDRNLDTQLNAARHILAARPDARILFACYRDEHRQRIAGRFQAVGLPAEAYVGRTAEVIHLAAACVAVSGSVGLELLYHGTPSVVVYRVNPVYRAISRRVLNVPYISLVNILAGRDVFPEYLTSHDPSGEVAGHILGWLNDPPSAARVQTELAALRARVGQPGACRRAAEAIHAIAARRRAA
jgi:lipid-A-disaccharide synthase